MRLTLRTLLAYLDDRLSPSNARELGQKISASPFARELAERIKGVVRKRRLAKLEPGQKTIDANLIAEYLDDQLTPELVALIEKEILASDHALAEVAAAHQILGQLADPLEIDEGLRKRLHQLDPVAEAEAGGAMTEAEISASEEWKPLAPAPTTSRRSPMLVLAVMVFGWLALLFVDQNLYRKNVDPVAANAEQNGEPNAGEKKQALAGQLPPQNGLVADSDPNPADAAANLAAQKLQNDNPIAKTDSDPDIKKARALTDVPGNNNIAEGNPNVDGTAAVGSQAVVADAGNPSVAANADTVQPAGTQPAPSNPVSSEMSDPKTPSDSSNVAMVKPAEPSVDVQGNPSDQAAAPKSRNHTLVADDPSGVLILSSLRKSNPADGEDAGSFREDEQVEWSWASNLEGTTSWNELLCDRLVSITSPFVATIGCQSAGWRVKVVGSSLVQGISGDNAGLKVLNGRLILSRQVADDNQPFLLQVGDRQLLLNPTDTMQRLAVDVRLLPMASSDESNRLTSLLSATDSVLVAFAAFGGPCEISQPGDNEVVTIPDGGQLVWNSGAKLSGNVIKQAMLAWEWVAVAEGGLAAEQVALHDTLAASLKVHRSVADAMAAVSEDSNPILAEWAVQIPIVHRNVEQLVGLLFQSEQHVVRSAAFRALQEIVKTVPGGRYAVVAMLETRLDLSEMDQAMKMVAEISRISLEDRLTSEWLIDMLDSDRLVLREMAISTLTQHLDHDNNYYADEEKSRRDRAVRRWKSELERNSGRLISPQE